MLKRTLNEWEAFTLEQLLSIVSEILYSGFDDPNNLQNRFQELSNELNNLILKEHENQNHYFSSR